MKVVQRPATAVRARASMIDAKSPLPHSGHCHTNADTVATAQHVHHTRRSMESGESVADLHSGKLLKMAAAPSAAIVE
jgi:hypothetical protein